MRAFIDRLLLIVTLLGAAGPASGQPRVLHELVTDSPAARSADEEPRAPAESGPLQTIDQSESEGGLPRAILRDGVGLPAPANSPAVGPDEQVSTPEGTPQDPSRPQVPREPKAQLDRSTGKDGRLTYHAVFNPSVSPYKRTAAFDRVGPDESLAVSSPSKGREIPVEGLRESRGHELFWGSLSVQLARGKRSPLPSVAPDAALLAYRATPPVEFRFSVDAAGNHWVEPRVPFEGSVRLVFLTEARSTYFGGPVPDFGLADIPRTLRRRVPRSVRERALRVLSAAGVAPQETPPREALARLVAYARAFEPGTLEPRTPAASTFEDIGLSQRGVCRHRSMVFTIAAQSYGLAARYVHNEAHAFVEVFLPGQGWRRIDLGGASDQLEVRNASGKIPHEPALADPFPWDVSESSGEGGREGGDGERSGPSGADGGDDGAAAPGSPREPGSEAGDTAKRQSSGADPPSGTAAETRPEAEEPRPDVDEAAATEQRSERASQAASPTRPKHRAELEEALGPVYRGERLEVAGRVVDDVGNPVGGALVRIVLRLSGGRQETLAGLRSDERGRFSSRVRIPPTLEPGAYEVDAQVEP